jgi:hypothetical protein
MKRFKIDYPVKGEMMSLYAEPMDGQHRMYSLERTLMDPHPLLIEHSENGWEVKSQDNWGLDHQDVNKLGDLLEKEYPHRPQQ